MTTATVSASPGIAGVAGSPGTAGACSSCHADLDHCHGVLVLHVDGTTECRGDRPCDDTSLIRHDWRGACGDVAEGCGCSLATAA